MPVRTGKDEYGCFAQWGTSGKKYRFTCNDKDAESKAKAKAAEQGRAIKASEENE
jgi:hypothetical protein